MSSLSRSGACQSGAGQRGRRRRDTYRLLLVAFSICSSKAVLAEEDHQLIILASRAFELLEEFPRSNSDAAGETVGTVGTDACAAACSFATPCSGDPVQISVGIARPQLLVRVFAGCCGYAMLRN